MRIETSFELPKVGEVIFFADLSEFSTENDGIGSYEYWGKKCYDHGTNYLRLEKDPHWDKSLYTEEQNNLIWDWVCEEAAGDNCPYQALCDLAEEPYAQQREDDKERYDLRNV
jgi:hypothetical protein